MEKDEKDRICERVLKFLGFHLSNGQMKYEVLSKNNYVVLGVDCNFTEMGSNIESNEMLFEFISKSKKFFTISEDHGIEQIENLFWRCSIEEMAIKLDLIA